MKLYLQGDIHGQSFWKSAYGAFRRDKTTMDKQFIFLGDLVDTHFGLCETELTPENFKIDTDRVLKNLDEIENIILKDSRVKFVLGNHELIRIGFAHHKQHNWDSIWLKDFVKMYEESPDYQEQFQRINGRVVQFVNNIHERCYLGLQYDDLLISHAGIVNGREHLYKLNQPISEKYIELNFDDIILDFEKENKDPWNKDFIKTSQIFGHYHIIDQDPKIPFPLVIGSGKDYSWLCIDDERSFNGKYSRWLVRDTETKTDTVGGTVGQFTERLKLFNVVDNWKSIYETWAYGIATEDGLIEDVKNYIGEWILRPAEEIKESHGGICWDVCYAIQEDLKKQSINSDIYLKNNNHSFLIVKAGEELYKINPKEKLYFNRIRGLPTDCKIIELNVGDTFEDIK